MGPESSRRELERYQYSEQEAFDQLEEAWQNKQPLNIHFIDEEGKSGHIRYNIISKPHGEEEELDIKGPHYEEHRKVTSYSNILKI
jgi:hypothetical protein